MNVSDLQTGYLVEADYNILDLASYNNIDDGFISVSMINELLGCKKELIIIDSKDDLYKDNSKRFVMEIKKIVNHVVPQFFVEENSVVEKISNSLNGYRIKTVGTYLPLNLVVEYEGKYFGIMIFENPGSTDFAIMNEYREINSSDFPIIIIWLSDLVDDYNKIIKKVVEGIRS